MLVFENIRDIRVYLKGEQIKKTSIGFVPTMGALHQGHLSLIQQSKKENDLTVCSIYINPTQFNNVQDLDKYPRTIKLDSELLLKSGCDVLFLPDNQMMYPSPAQLSFSFGFMEEVMEGKFRKGHFNGVALVVSKLFHIIQPDRVYLGQKDLQQCTVIQQLCTDLMFDLEVIVCPTFREKDGLAMSSRNMRLNESQRKIAPQIYKSLCLAKDLLLQKKSVEDVKNEIEIFFSKESLFELEYFEIVDSNKLQDVEDIDAHSQISICIAAFLGEVRLIDNLFLS